VKKEKVPKNLHVVRDTSSHLKPLFILDSCFGVGGGGSGSRNVHKQKKIERKNLPESRDASTSRAPVCLGVCSACAILKTWIVGAAETSSSSLLSFHICSLTVSNHLVERKSDNKNLGPERGQTVVWAPSSAL
jgi:hypothetical protein